jgi:hypothetical protein
MDVVETQIAEWRAYVSKAPAVDASDVEELEAHLRDQISQLGEAGLAADEAFLVAVKRMGDVDGLSREFAREHSGRLWKQLVVPGETPSESSRGWIEALAFAVPAAIVVQIARLVHEATDESAAWFGRNFVLFVLPFLAAYFGRRRGLDARGWALTAVPFVVAALALNLYPFARGADVEPLAVLHAVVALWFAVAYPYMGGTLSSHDKRMDYVRFTGEWLIYYVLIALGGGVLIGLTAAILQPADAFDVEQVFEWVVPSGIVGAVIVAAWLVESKQRVVENMAPVLTMLFTPMFAVMLVVAVAVHASTGFDGAFDREMLGVYDALLVVVLGLVLYGMSARDASAPPGWMDRIQLVAVCAALVLDVLVLGAMVVRVGDLGFTPNRTVALGLNLALLANLGRAAWLAADFLRGRATFGRLELWQTAYLPVFALWAAIVVVVLPPLFDFS